MTHLTHWIHTIPALTNMDKNIYLPSPSPPPPFRLSVLLDLSYKVQ
jgi:hypothetical protein